MKPRSVQLLRRAIAGTAGIALCTLAPCPPARAAEPVRVTDLGRWRTRFRMRHR